MNFFFLSKRSNLLHYTRLLSFLDKETEYILVLKLRDQLLTSTVINSLLSDGFKEEVKARNNNLFSNCCALSTYKFFLKKMVINLR